MYFRLFWSFGHRLFFNFACVLFSGIRLCTLDYALTTCSSAMDFRLMMHMWICYIRMSTLLLYSFKIFLHVVILNVHGVECFEGEACAEDFFTYIH